MDARGIGGNREEFRVLRTVYGQLGRAIGESLFLADVADVCTTMSGIFPSFGEAVTAGWRRISPDLDMQCN